MVGDPHGPVFTEHEFHTCGKPALTGFSWCLEHVCNRCKQLEVDGASAVCQECLEESMRLGKAKKARKALLLTEKKHTRKQMLHLYLAVNGVPPSVVKEITEVLDCYGYRNFIMTDTSQVSNEDIASLF
jgi:hypothetical protein